MGLINNPNKNADKEVKIIERAPVLKPNDSFKINDTKAKQAQKNIDRVTFDTSVRMNNHIKNQLQAMTLLGIAKNQAEAIDLMLVEWLNSIDESTEQMFKLQVDMLEKKDVLNFNRK